MSFSRYIHRVKFIDSLIGRRATGNAETLAKKLNLSKVGTYKFINELKEEGLPIAYSREIKSYYYTREGDLANFLLGNDITTEEMRKINGGLNLFDIVGRYCNNKIIFN
jgi:hypothetical protein